MLISKAKVSVILFSLISFQTGFSQDSSPNGMDFSSTNPVTPYALNDEGEARGFFKIPYSALVEYYKYVGQGSIIENASMNPIFDMDMDVITGVHKKDLEFYFNLERKTAYPAQLINPHSVAHLFSVDPVAYTNHA